MANNLRFNVQVEFTPDGQSQPIPVLSLLNKLYELDSKVTGGGIQSVGTTAETLDLGSVGTEHLLLLWNLDSANACEYGYDSTGFVKTGVIPPGMPAILWVDGSKTWQGKAQTAAVDLFIQAFEVNT